MQEYLIGIIDDIGLLMAYIGYMSKVDGLKTQVTIINAFE